MSFSKAPPAKNSNTTTNGWATCSNMNLGGIFLIQATIQSKYIKYLYAEKYSQKTKAFVFLYVSVRSEHCVCIKNTTIHLSQGVSGSVCWCCVAQCRVGMKCSESRLQWCCAMQRGKALPEMHGIHDMLTLHWVLIAACSKYLPLAFFVTHIASPYGVTYVSHTICKSIV